MSGSKPRELILAGKLCATDRRKAVVRPADGSVYATVFTAGPGEVEETIAAACRAFERTRALPSYVRSEVCRRMAAAIADEGERLAADLANEAGKPIQLARAEVGRAVLTFRTAAEEAMRIGGELLPLDAVPDAEGVFGITRRFPIGPVAAITPFNFPLNLVAHKLAPAVASGCPIVLKPASATPLSALNLGGLLLRTEWPPEALSILPCSAEVAAPLVEDERLRLVTFTGSAEVGWGIKARAGKKRVALELGGNAAAVIDASADLDFAAARCAVGGFAYAGQSCISVQRIFVHGSVEKAFIEKFLAQVRSLKTGDPLDPAVMAGPLITRGDAERIESWVDEAVAKGASLLAGGKREGSFYQPTVLAGVDPSLPVSCNEVFGPVVVVDTFEEWREALHKVNDSAFGLQAGVFTKDIDKVLAAFSELEVGGVVVNDVPTYRVDPQPYGGVKDSGTGREGPRFAIEEMTELRLLLIRRRLQ
jgi:acyl-CoA reductase-like NAD-dependent aldehyde dehydrogenase